MINTNIFILAHLENHDSRKFKNKKTRRIRISWSFVEFDGKIDRKETKIYFFN
jgi:hypothetical protein